MRIKINYIINLIWGLALLWNNTKCGTEYINYIEIMEKNNLW